MQLLRVTPDRVIEIPLSLFSSSAVELLLENVSQHTFVAYKIKTTAPKSYLVRPSSGVIPKGECRTVQIVLQAFGEEMPRTSTDRFLVQATPVDSSVPLPRSYWVSLSKADVEEMRLNVAFKHPVNPAAAAAGNTLGGSSVPAARPNAAAADPAAPPAPAAAVPAAAADGLGSSSSSNAAAAAAAPSSSSSGGDLKQQYDQLIEYALAMERHKEELAKENEALRQQLEAKSCRGAAELWHFPVYLFVFVMIWFLLDRSWGSSASSAKQ